MAAILLAEDDDLVAEALAATLRLDDHEVTIAANGETAVAALKSRYYDLVITDMLMPEGGGAVVAGMARVLQGHQRIILISGYLKDDISGRARRTMLEGLGIRRFLHKPIEMDELRGAVAEALAEIDADAAGAPVTPTK